MEDFTRSINSMVGDLSAKLNVFAPSDPMIEIEKMSNKELENYVKTEEGANLLEKYQQYLILLKKLNLDACRSSNQASTRLGNLNQMLTENTDSYLKLTGELRKVPDITKQVNAMHAKIDVLHKYLLQAELALWQLESLKGETSF